MFGSGIYGYVILKDGVSESDKEVIKGLRNIVRSQIGGFAVPEILMVNSIIHTLTIQRKLKARQRILHSSLTV